MRYIEPWCDLQNDEWYVPRPNPTDAGSCPTIRKERSCRPTRERRRWRSASDRTNVSWECRSWVRHVSSPIRSEFCLRQKKKESGQGPVRINTSWTRWYFIGGFRFWRRTGIRPVDKRRVGSTHLENTTRSCRCESDWWRSAWPIRCAHGGYREVASFQSSWTSWIKWITWWKTKTRKPRDFTCSVRGHRKERCARVRGGRRSACIRVLGLGNWIGYVVMRRPWLR